MQTITKTINLYKFDELSEEAKQSALNELSDINVDYDWWQFIYDDAEAIGVEIEGFDIDRPNYCNIKLDDDMSTVVNAILRKHTPSCDSYAIAERYSKQWAQLVAKYSDGVKLDEVAEGKEDDFDEHADGLTEDFTYALQEYYLEQLKEEYDYQTSDGAIIETIKCNEYDFTESGKLYS